MKRVLRETVPGVTDLLPYFESCIILYGRGKVRVEWLLEIGIWCRSHEGFWLAIRIGFGFGWSFIGKF